MSEKVKRRPKAFKSVPRPPKIRFWSPFGVILGSFWCHFGLSFDCFWNLFGLLVQGDTQISQAIKRIPKIKQVSASFQTSQYSSGSAGFRQQYPSFARFPGRSAQVSAVAGSQLCCALVLRNVG